MSVKYKIIPRINPQDPSKPSKYYGQAVADGKTDFETLVALVAASTPMNKIDCLRVLMNLEAVLKNELKNGRIVSLGGIGDFQLSATSIGFDTEKQVTKSTLKSAKINFRAGKGLKKMMSEVEFKKT
ncbi:MAG: HU family DNA-binding protein [Lutibacter sp.]